MKPKVAIGPATVAGWLTAVLAFAAAAAAHFTGSHAEASQLVPLLTGLGALAHAVTAVGRYAQASKPAAKPPPAVRAHRKHAGHVGYVVMYDDTSPESIPAGAPAVAGYVGGAWPDYAEDVKRWPHARHLSIAVNSGEDAMCLDIENGDATPRDAPAWVRRQHARGVKRPVVYARLSVMPSVILELQGAGIHRSEYRVWDAHYTYVPHVSAGSDATQWTDRALGRSLDESLCAPSFWGA